MADSTPVMVWLSGPDGKRTYVNQRWLDFTGRPLDQELGDSWITRVHPEDQAAVGSTLAMALGERRPFTAEYRLARRDGQYRWLLDHGAPRRADDGVLLGYVGSAVDVTQLRAAQQALLETDLLRSAIFGSLYGHVAALDKHGRIIAVNQAWLRFAVENGGDPARVSIGANYIDVCRDAVETGDPDAPRVLEAVCTVLAGGTPRQVEYAFQTPGGERWYEMTVEPLRRPEEGVLVTHVDVTRRRQAEEEAQRQRDELAHVLRTTTLGELAASLAHEINQPLAAIVANAQATRRLLDAGRASRPGVVETLNDIVDDAKRASQVIRRLRALFRKEHVEPRPVDFNEVVEDAMGVLHHDAERRRISVRCALARGLEPVRGDPVQLQQVLLNVLVNACEAIAATEDGPREVTIETSALAAGGVAVSIRDTGIGVKDGDLERIFEHFVSTKVEGLGMGLAISRSIVQAHGGRIWATAERRPGHHPPPGAALPAGAGPRMMPEGVVYVVDDDASVRRALARLIAAAGLEVETFPSARAFLDRTPHDRPGCLVLDVRLPGESGLDLQTAMGEARHRLPIIFVTGHGTVPASVRAMKEGALDFLQKPVDEQELLDGIQRALRRSHEARAEQAERATIQRRLDTLTPREREVLDLVATGLLNKQIGDRLGVAEKTIKVHRGRAMQKMATDSVADLVRLLNKLGPFPSKPLRAGPGRWTKGQ